MSHNLEQVPLEKALCSVKKEFLSKTTVIPWHIHPQYELVYLRMNHGVKQIGNHFGEIVGGELLLVGPNLLHSWKTNDTLDCVSNNDDYQVVVNFDSNVFGEDLLAFSPFTGIRSLLKKAEMGLRITGEAVAHLGAEMESMLLLDDFDKSLALIKLLDKLSKVETYSTLSTIQPAPGAGGRDRSKRMTDVFSYVNLNFKENIPLKKIADVASMTPQAFCKYFKETTKKTFVEFVNEIRIGHACRLMIDSDLSIMQICYESGFNNLSNFNRQFKKATCMSPMSFRSQVLSKRELPTKTKLPITPSWRQDRRAELRMAL